MSKPLRILVHCRKDFYAANGVAFTGAQHFTSNLFNHFDATAHTLIGIATDKRPEKPGVKVTQVKRGDKPWLKVNISISTQDILDLAVGRASPQTLQIVADLASAFKRSQADLFFMNGLSALNYLFMRAAIEVGLPVVSTHHGLWYLEATVHPGISRLELKQRKTLERDLIRYSQRNIFLTKLSYRKFKKLIGRVSTKNRRFVTLPYNPLFADKQVPPKKTRARLRVGLVGRWDPIKNHQAFLALAAEAKRQDLPWDFIAATSVDPKVKTLNPILKSYTEFIPTLPHMSPAELKKFYRSLDIVVVPSIFETFCGVVMEAVLQNTPVLISPGVGWVDDFKKYGLRRWIVSFARPKRVIRRIREIVGQKPPADLIRDIIQSNHPKAIFAEYEKIFSEVVEEYENRSAGI